MFEGVLPAIITPFKKSPSAELDIEGLRYNVESILGSGIHGIVPCGSTGESATLTFEEHEQVIGEVIDAVNGKVPVVAGTGSNNTAEAIRLTREAKNLGADGVLVISPYYNKPNESGLIKHYTGLADLDIPVIIYNIPGRTGQNLSPDLIAKLAEHPGIAGVKEASGSINQVSEIIEKTRDFDFTVIAGDDNMTYPMMALGGGGVISVTANIEPELMVRLYDHMKAGEFDRALDLHYRISPLIRALFIDTNPIPIKAAMEIRGKAAGPMRLPLDALSREKTDLLRRVLLAYD